MRASDGSKAVAAKAVASLDTCAGKRRRDARAYRRRTERVGRKASSTYTYRVCLSEAASRSGVVFAQVATKYITWSSMCGRRKQHTSSISSGRINQVTQDQPGSIEREKMLVEEVLYSSLVDLHYCTSFSSHFCVCISS